LKEIAKSILSEKYYLNGCNLKGDGKYIIYNHEEYAE